ncbi:HDIG domain-containing protein [Natronincola peptidivorans]|uniref:HDIG domain-containing protein n=1 Tax=Natronincola peptidivorans TaxID=426128 RepID=A0A1I0DNG6_9FIRM|nr:HD domain-containing protein [Natronincola peptidivorans]SET33747.1 HDIG domain-containing protein [Natronincola peptidivorans]
MERIKRILNHDEYNHHLENNSRAEEKRGFCRHDLQHFLAVARVGYIIALERRYKVSKEMIYAAALLHDIAKWKQYLEGVNHAIASAKVAEDLLEECGFSPEETKTISDAIKKHRKGKDLETELDISLYEGDKKSRLCVKCHKLSDCKKYKEGKKPQIQY